MTQMSMMIQRYSTPIVLFYPNLEQRRNWKMTRVEGTILRLVREG